MKEIVAIDADDVLFDENEHMRIFQNQQYGVEHSTADYLVDGEYWGYWERIWGVSDEEGNQRFTAYVEYKMRHHSEPIPGALEELERRKDDYHFVLNTARPGDAFEVTKEALARFYPGIFADVHFIALWGSPQKVTKAEVCLAIGARHLIDDGFEHTSLAADAGIDAMLYGDLGWNRWQPLRLGMTRVRNWRDVGAHLDAQR
ncbi:MAG TPA: hypothetical protein VGE30_03425 [Candidatus Saccharimonadales bacterium]